MSTAAAAAAAPDLLAAFSGHNDLLGGQPAYRRQRLAAARAFLEAHPDFDAWMAAPVDARRVELRRRPFAWQLVAFAIVSGWCRADPEFLFAKNFGHSIARWIAALFPADVDRLNAAAGRAGAADAEVAVREVLSLTVAFTGRPPSSLTVEDLDRLGEAIDTTPRLSASMRRGRRAQLFRLRRLLFEAGMVDLPAQHRREGGPATRQARLAVVASPEIRRTLLAYLDVRATVLRPKTIEKLTSALAIFGEFICDHDPALHSLTDLERRHIEAFLAWTATRASRGSHDRTRTVGPHVHAHAAITVRALLDDITAWGWADAPRRRLMFDTDIPRQPDSLPRALPPDIDAAVMAAVADLHDRFARVGITVLRHTGLRIGELLDLEVDHLVDYGPNGTWLRVPLGKLNNERSVPVDNTALEALDDWLAHRPSQRAPVNWHATRGAPRLGGRRPRGVRGAWPHPGRRGVRGP